MIQIPEMKQLKLEVIEDSIAVLTINRPEKMNALNKACFYDVKTFVDFLDETTEIRAGIITGEGKAFSAGLEPDALLGKEYFVHNIGKEGFAMLEFCRKPIIAAINGYALGGGLELALCCDIRIMSNTASLGLPETALGIIPGAGGMTRLTKIAGMAVAKDIVLTGRKYKADEALLRGIVTQVTAPEELMNTAIDIAKGMISRGPLALTLAKRNIDLSVALDKSTALQYEDWALYLVKQTEDSVEGKQAMIEKRPPQFKGC